MNRPARPTPRTLVIRARSRVGSGSLLSIPASRSPRASSPRAPVLPCCACFPPRRLDLGSRGHTYATRTSCHAACTGDSNSTNRAAATAATARMRPSQPSTVASIAHRELVAVRLAAAEPSIAVQSQAIASHPTAPGPPSKHMPRRWQERRRRTKPPCQTTTFHPTATSRSHPRPSPPRLATSATCSRRPSAYR